jgi:hypothetical protein
MKPLCTINTLIKNVHFISLSDTLNQKLWSGGLVENPGGSDEHSCWSPIGKVCQRLKTLVTPSLVAHACNPSTWEAKAERLKVPGQPGLHSETLLQKKKTIRH